MATDDRPARFARGTTTVRSAPYAFWWPYSRRLSDELATLFELWPPDAGRIARVLYSPPDWDDRPRSAAVPGRSVKTGSFPADDTHQLVLTMLDGRRLVVGVIAADTPTAQAARLLGDAAGGPASVAGAAGQRGRGGWDEARAAWDNEGGHP